MAMRSLYAAVCVIAVVPVVAQLAAKWHSVPCLFALEGLLKTWDKGMGKRFDVANSHLYE